MRHDYAIVGHRHRLRPVEMADAGFILSLRMDPKLSRFVGATSSKLEDQQEWLGRYFDRADDFYFIITDAQRDEDVGTVGIYNLDTATHEAEWGRWLIRPGSIAALESALLLHRLGFESIGLRRLYSRTVAENAQVVSFHTSFGAQRDRILRAGVILDDGPHDLVEHSVERAAWERLQTRLTPLAERAARHS
jgi:RimJ/RimL family protein N-acetyltransferase